MEHAILKKCEDPLYSVQLISLRRPGFTCSSGWFHHSSLEIQLFGWGCQRTAIFLQRSWFGFKDLAVLLMDIRDRSLSHLFIVFAVRIVCLLGSGPRRRSGVSTYPDTVNEQHLGSILGMWPMFPSNMRFEPSILVSPDQTKLFAIVWESFRLHLCFVFTLTCTVRP